MKIVFVLIGLLFGINNSFCQDAETIYNCIPCNLLCDTLSFEQVGICPHCKMKLISEREVSELNNLVVNEVAIKSGSGVFIIEGGKGREEKSIKVFYYMPKDFTPASRILLIIPGAGRNADDYRNAWIEASEKYNVLVLSPHYSEIEYDITSYQLGGLLSSLNLHESLSLVPHTNIIELDEQRFRYTINSDHEQWIFNDFDRIFNLVISATGSRQNKYDVFGHSAGGQILHRMALFHPQSKTNRILASNSGFYTMPDPEASLPFGMKDVPLNVQNLKSSFNNKLILFLGELDNENESGGTLLHSPTANKQGLHRLARGKHFFAQSQEYARKLDADFQWKLIVIPNIGHDYKRMSAAAAVYLYGSAGN